MDLNGTTALITGASGGIGEEFAVQLASRNVNLVLAARREEKLQQLRTRLIAQHPNLEVDVVVADLAKPGAAKELVDAVQAKGRRIDVLINNAGVGAHGAVAEESADELVAQIQLNCTSLVDLVARLIPPMVEAKKGVVLNVASTAGFQPIPTMAVYGATKAFVVSFTEALWEENRRTGVRVLALCPGPTETEFFERTGEKFMTSGRQTPKQVVATALKALDGSGPTVISGLRNKLLAPGYRITPRRLLPRIAAAMVATSH